MAQVAMAFLSSFLHQPTVRTPIMSLDISLSFFVASVLTTGFLAYWKLFIHFDITQQTRKVSSSSYLRHGCAPPKSTYPHHPLLFYLDLFFWVSIDVINRRFTEGIRQLFARYGTTWTARLAYRNLICTIDPENLQSFMATNFDDWTVIPPRQKLIRLCFGDGVFSTEGAEWRHSRSMIREGMKRVDLDIDIFEKHASELVQRMRDQQDGTIDLGKLIQDYTMGISADLILGPDTSNERRIFEDDFRILGKMAKELTIFVRAIPGLPTLLYGRSFTATRNSILAYVRTRTSPATANCSIISTLSQTTFTTTTTQDPSRAVSEALNLILAGRDTTGINLTETFYLLARHPTAWRQLRAEALALGPIPSLTALQHLPYLAHTINESLRLRPALAVHGRLAVRDTVLPRGGGAHGDEPLFVPRGAFVLYSNYALHRDAAVFGADVDAFRPQRWETIAPLRYEFLGWGAGPRHCPGKKLAWRMLAFLVVRLVREFEGIEKVGDEEWEEERAFSFANRHGCKVRVVTGGGDE